MMQTLDRTPPGSLSASLSHTHTQSLQLFSLATTNLSAGSSGWDSHQLLRFTQKPKTSLKVLECMSVVMREIPKGNLWKSNTICCWLSSSHLPALIIHFDLCCVTLANCVDVFFKMGETLKNLKMLERGCQSQRLRSSVFPAHYTGTQASQRPKGLVRFLTDSTKLSCWHEKVMSAPEALALSGLLFNTSQWRFNVQQWGIFMTSHELDKHIHCRYV